MTRWSLSRIYFWAIISLSVKVCSINFHHEFVWCMLKCNMLGQQRLWQILLVRSSFVKTNILPPSLSISLPCFLFFLAPCSLSEIGFVLFTFVFCLSRSSVSTTKAGALISNPGVWNSTGHFVGVVKFLLKEWMLLELWAYVYYFIHKSLSSSCYIARAFLYAWVSVVNKIQCLCLQIIKLRNVLSNMVATCGYVKLNVNSLKLKIQFLSHTSHILSAYI